MEQLVRSYYDRNAEREHQRLTRPFGVFEFQGTLTLFSRYLPKNSKICDVGAGTGRYSVELMKQGHRVTLYELSSELLAIARREVDSANVVADDFICDDAANLGTLAPESFDAVLLMGPMYHVIDDSRRSAILSAASSILRPGGLLFSAYINSYGVLITGLEEFPQEFAGESDILRMLQIFRHNDPGDGSGFTHALFYPPDVAVEEVHSAGFEVVTYAGVEGVATADRVAMAKLQENNPNTYGALLGANPHFIEKSPFRDLAGHIVVVGRKPY